jgi:glycosyltransferase involved in cell wall biosynthesis
VKVLHVNTRVRHGGAGEVCYRLHSALQADGQRSRIVSVDRVRGRDDLQTFVPPSAFWWLLRHANWWLEMKLGLEGLINVTSWAGHRRHAAWAEVVNLHNIHSYFFSLFLLPRLERYAPLVWTLHDEWALTGHCAFPLDCERWQTGCGSCPNLLGPPRIDVDTTRLLWRARRWVYRRVSPTLVAPSRWLLRRVRVAPLTESFRSVHVPHGIGTDVFRPLPREAARQIVGVAPGEKVLMLTGNSLTRDVKGKGLALRALRRLRQGGVEDVRLLLAGGGGDRLPELPFPATQLGRVESDRFMVAAYSAADVFFGPSRSETFGLVFLESMACGTPCVGFRAAAVPELVEHGTTGLLAPAYDAHELAACLHRLLTDDGLRERASRACRRVAVESYPIGRMVRRYTDLYEQLLEERARQGAG